MSLLAEAFEPFVIVNKSIVEDGYGGVTTAWTDGATIYGALVLDNSAEATIAQALGVNETYTLTVQKHIELDYHTVIRRSDNSVFRLTSNTDDKKTPNSAALDMRQYSCERWQLN